MSKLVIVESPAKAKTLKKFLGAGFKIKASVGHVKDLPKKELGVDIEKDFAPNYVVIKGKKSVLNDIKKAAKDAEKVYLAPDPDREGEAIAWHIAQEIGKKDKVLRAIFHEITQKAVRAAIEHPQKLDENKFNAQQARRILDRLVGYQISPLLWQKVKRGLSAGRVQSVALRLICEREEEIKNFVPEEYWTIDALLEGKNPPSFKARVFKFGDEKVEIKNEEKALSILKDLEGHEFIVKNIERKERKQYPTPPFITSRLQQESYRKLHFTVKKTMMIAQHLYEGVDLGSEGSVGLITYMRTDSPRVSDDALSQVREFILKNFGKDYLPDGPNVYKARKSAQEAHEAIRPTSLDYTPEMVKKYLEEDDYALYKLIWDRFIASQMTPAIYDQTVVDVSAAAYILRATGSVIKFPGFMSIYIEGMDETEDEKEATLPVLDKGEKLKLLKIDPEQHFTKPPGRYTESTLVKELEEKGIGRPSTYATILSTIQQKEYVTKEKGRFKPTELGKLITELLVKSFPNVLNVKFTADMEDNLDDIEEGKANWIQTLKIFYHPFRESLEKARKEMRNVKAEEVPTEFICEKCGERMVIKWGRNGEFIACPNYPRCRNVKDFTRDDAGKIIIKEREKTSEVCEKCGSPMEIKRGRYGEFLACSAYPKCKNTKPLLKPGEELINSGQKCERCGGNMLVKKARAGNRFLSCENYPKCKNVISFKIGVPCPQCGSEIVERSTRKGRLFYGCEKYPECTYATWEYPTNSPKAN